MSYRKGSFCYSSHLVQFVHRHNSNPRLIHLQSQEEERSKNTQSDIAFAYPSRRFEWFPDFWFRITIFQWSRQDGRKPGSSINHHAVDRHCVDDMKQETCRVIATWNVTKFYLHQSNASKLTFRSVCSWPHCLLLCHHRQLPPQYLPPSRKLSSLSERNTHWVRSVASNPLGDRSYL